MGPASHTRPVAGHDNGMSTLTPPSEAGFRRLYERTSSRVYGYVRRYCAEADCDDIVAEVFLVAWRRFGELSADPLPWLLTVARKTLANYWRSGQRRDRLAVEALGVAQLAGPDCASEAIERATMLDALAALRADDREILFLTGWDGLDSAGAAQVLGISAAAARARLARARRRLVAQFDDEPPARPSGLSLLVEGN